MTAAKRDSVLFTIKAINLFHLCTPASIEQLLSIDFPEVEKFLCVIQYSSCETFQTRPPFKPLNGSVSQKTGHALPSPKKSITTLNLPYTQNNHSTG